MKFSLQSMAFPHPRDVFCPDNLRLLKSLGFDGLEVVPERFSSGDARKIRELANDNGLDLMVAWSLGPEHDLACPDPAVRQAGIDHLKHLIDLSEIMEASNLSGLIFAGCGCLTGLPPTEEELDWAAKACREAAVYAEKADVVLNMEPATREDNHLINTVEQGLSFLDRINAANVKLLLDTFQMLREENSLGEAIRSAKGTIGLFHLSENHRGIPGTGSVPWPEVFHAMKEINFDGWVSIETFFDPHGVISPRAKVWRRLGESLESVVSQGLAFIREGLKK